MAMMSGAFPIAWRRLTSFSAGVVLWGFIGAHIRQVEQRNRSLRLATSQTLVS
jgi:hypothetical protein